MKVSGSSGPTLATPARARGGVASGAFGVGGSSAAASTAPTPKTSAMSAVSSLDALLALQDVEGPLERRRRAVRRATHILDVLDDVKLSLLDGEAGEATLHRLSDAVRSERAQTQDANLEGVLNEIETRAAVELAKREFARAA